MDLWEIGSRGVKNTRSVEHTYFLGLVLFL
jgi:hypothetical protein